MYLAAIVLLMLVLPLLSVAAEAPMLPAAIVGGPVFVVSRFV